MGRIVFIGSGNLATHLSQALSAAGEHIVQVYSPNPAHAGELASKFAAAYVSNLDDVVRDADIYILSIKDDALAQVIGELCPQCPDALFLHTAGSVPASVFEGFALHYGVLYPLQTFSKSREVDFAGIPCFVEASDTLSLGRVRSLALEICSSVTVADSEKRRKIHLAAVFASNMANHCYRMAEKLLEQENIPFECLIPLIKETAAKVETLSPRDAQTGPMVRGDRRVMSRQMSLLSDPLMRDIYRLFAESIGKDR